MDTWFCGSERWELPNVKQACSVIYLSPSLSEVYFENPVEESTSRPTATHVTPMVDVSWYSTLNFQFHDLHVFGICLACMCNGQSRRSRLDRLMCTAHPSTHVTSSLRPTGSSFCTHEPNKPPANSAPNSRNTTRTAALEAAVALRLCEALENTYLHKHPAWILFL